MLGEPALDPGRRRRRARARARRRGPGDARRGSRHLRRATSARCSTTAPQITIDDGADLLVTAHEAGGGLLEGLIGGTEETTTGLVRLRRLEEQGELALPGARGQRGAHRACAQRPPRHRPVGARRDRAREPRAARRADGRGRRLRLGRAGDRRARARRRRRGDRLRGRPAARARGADGRLRGDAGARGGRARRHLRHRHRLAPGAAPRALRADEGRRAARQRRALRRRARPRRAARAGRRRGAPGASAGRAVRARATAGA